nr:reverse transcriptase domain-containing protein [Tanacetum cinerariifolium]
MLSCFFQNQSSTSGTLPSNTIPNSKGEMKAITTRSGVAYEGPSIPTPKKVVERETEEITDREQTNFQGSTGHIQPPVIPIPEPDVPKTLPKPNIPYPLRLNDQKLCEKATNQMEKFFQIFQDFHFDISFADALLLMPKFASMIKSLLANKDKLFELAKIPLNENWSAMLLKKLRDPGKFLIPFDFPGMDVCHDLTDLADPRVPIIFGRSFLRTGRALMDVYGEEITLRVNDEAVSVNLNLATRYSSTYDDMSVNGIDVTNVAREEYAQEMLGFSNNSLGGNPTSTSEPIIFDSSPSITPFEGSDFILEEIEAYLKDESISSEIDHDWPQSIDYRKLNDATRKDHFPLPFMDQMLERLAGNEFYCFLDGFSGHFQIPINPPDQKMTTFTCLYGIFAYQRMPFGICNAPRTFQRCMMEIFQDMIEKTMGVFMDDFSVFGDSFLS